MTKENSLQTLVLSLLLVLGIGTMLYIGQALLLPIVTAIILIYLLESTAAQLRRLPLVSWVPEQIVRLFLLVGLILIIVALGIIVSATVQEIIAVAPRYQENLRAMADEAAVHYHFDEQELWDEIREQTVGRIDLRALFLAILGGFTNLGAIILLISIYAAFLMAERASFQRRLAAALKDRAQHQRVSRVLADINVKISRYLAFKTLINLILGTTSYVILVLFGVDFALFWAVVIGMLNYIPYVGSYLGVFFPVALSLAQFGSLPVTLGLAVSLSSAQFVLGNIIEPRLIGRQLNLSPFVVLLALASWTALWGIPGAILAVPLTSILTIILSSFDSTRWLALLLAERVDDELPVPAEPVPAEPVARG
ncbi:AI-2E family transporter [Pseudooceanicola sp. HF7]|uniref:AI-2E family transporter n=1 Tax=Pseudooceanicola sp. HF7 TaxID=2721560 RepID=UPI0014314974|nr:AI-2E family transporter [Pseudooceanicola sp. HF7]